MGTGVRTIRDNVNGSTCLVIDRRLARLEIRVGLKLSQLNPFRLLNSVPFGIVLMVLTGVFIACGSARPWFREIGVDEWPILRDWFDKTDLQFFNAWPLTLLMALLVANLIVVTWRKIPLTPPRYGVWCIHSGIITLICGTAFYYHYKVEGRVRIFLDPQQGPNTVDQYYDKDERSIYVRFGQSAIETPLPTLPRFKEYDEKLGNAGALARRGLTGIKPTTYKDPGDPGSPRENLAEIIGCKGEMKFDVTGFYPYATTSTDFVTDPTSKINGVDITLRTTTDQQVMGETWLIGTDPRFRFDGDTYRFDEKHAYDLEHIDGDKATAAGICESAEKIFQLVVTASGRPGGDEPQSIYVTIGKTYPIGQTGYSIQVEYFDPEWSMFGTGERVSAMLLKVTSPTQTYRRMVLQDKPLQTDFKLEGPGMGKRQKKPLDDALKVEFHLSDPFGILPIRNRVKHTLLTPTDGTELIDIVAGIGSTPCEIRRFPNGVEDIDINAQSAEPDPPFMQGLAPGQGPFSGPVAGAPAMPDATQPTTMPAAAADAGEGANHPSIRMHLERRDHLRAVDSVLVVPPARRNHDDEDSGRYQLARVHVSLGDWSQDVLVPFADDAGDRLQQETWRGGYCSPPGAIAPIQLQLGNRRRPLPVELTLRRFEVVPYPGATSDTPNAVMRDFISTVSLTDPVTGDETTEVAQMNHPIYFRHGDWLFFQSGFDPSPGHHWSILGVGNRPGVNIMIAGCIMIFVGLAYAFYVKPIIIQRMKQKALAKAVAAGKIRSADNSKELVLK